MVGALVPCLGVLGEFFKRCDSSFAETLSAEESDFDFGLIEPASVLRCVVDREPAPQPAAFLFAEPVGRRFAGVGGKVVEHQVNRIDGRVGGGDVEQELGEVG